MPNVRQHQIAIFLPRTDRKPPDTDRQEVGVIKHLGYDTTRVASAEAALGALADRRAVDIVFSDVMMPGKMNGVELAQEIRRRRPNLAILLTSGYADSASRSAISTTGCAER